MKRSFLLIIFALGAAGLWPAHSTRADQADLRQAQAVEQPEVDAGVAGDEAVSESRDEAVSESSNEWFGSPGDDRSPSDSVAARRRKSRTNHFTATRTPGGAASAASAPQLLVQAPARPKPVDEITIPAVRWTNQHPSLLANPPPSFA